MSKLSSLAVAALLLVACDDDDDTSIAYSAPVGINLKAKSGDVKSGAIDDEKDITTESGNPYAAFTKAARDELGGNDPSRIEVASLKLLLGAQSNGVTALEEVFTGKVEVLFLINDSNNSYPVGSIDAPTGGGPLALTVNFNSTTLSPNDWTKFLAGSFKVVIRGTAASGFDKKGAEADLQLTFTFKAFE